MPVSLLTGRLLFQGLMRKRQSPPQPEEQRFCGAYRKMYVSLMTYKAFFQELARER